MADTTLYPTADAMVSEASPDTNYGSNANLASRTWADKNIRTFLKFDLSGLPAGAVISLAKLRLNCWNITNLVAGVTDVQTRQVADDSWIEDEITWTNQKAYGDVEDTKVPSVAVIEWTVTDYVQDEYDGDQTISFCTRCVTESYDATERSSLYRSKEYNGDDPELYIEYTVPIKVTITDSLGMLDSVTKVKGLTKTITDLQGMTDSVTKQFDAKKTITDKQGMLDTTPTKAAFHLTVNDKQGMTDTVTRVKHMFQIISDIQGMVDTTSTKAALKQAIIDVMGMLDTITRGFPLKVTITDIQGMRDRIVTKKRRYPLPDLPDHTKRGGASD